MHYSCHYFLKQLLVKFLHRKAMQHLASAAQVFGCIWVAFSQVVAGRKDETIKQKIYCLQITDVVVYGIV